MTWGLECWGRGWNLRNCKEIPIPEVPFKKITLVPYTTHAVRLKLAPSNNEGSLGTGTLETEIENLDHFQGRQNSTVTKEKIHNFLEFPKSGIDQQNSRRILTEFKEDENVVLDDINPYQIYRITIAPHKYGNSSTLFFRIYDNTSSSSSSLNTNSRFVSDENLIVRAEEVCIVVLILALWMIAIGLFVHRWGKIRMLEPYQPDYKAIHNNSCSLNQGSSPTHSQHHVSMMAHPRPPSFKALPRKSSSLCFTPSMLKTVHIPSTYRMSIPRIDFHAQTNLKGYPPHSRHALHRLRGRISSDSSSSQPKFMPVSDLCRKARSAENLQPARMNISLGRSMDESNNGAKRETRRKSTSLECCRPTRYAHPGKTAIRGASLDSAAHSKSHSGTLWWNQGMGSSCPFPDGRTTPEIRISPTPPESIHHPITYSHPRKKESGGLNHSHSYPHSRPPGLQRQEPLDETFYPLPYATLHEEENEGEEITIKAHLMSFSNNSSQESQESHLSHVSRSSHFSQESRLSEATQSSIEDYHGTVMTQDTKV